MDIVVKIEGAVADGGAAPVPAGSLTADLAIRVQAESVSGQRKYAEVWADRGSRSTTRWGITCDEGVALGGEDSAPAPLVYFAASVAFCLLTQIARCAEMKKLQLDDVRIDQTLSFWRQGSVVRGTIESGCSAVDVAVRISSPEPAERIADLVRIAEEACFVRGALARPVEISTSLSLNGRDVPGPTTAEGGGAADG